MYTKSQNWANFGLTCIPEKGAWLRNGMRGYRKFGLKRCARLQRKSHETVRRDLLALRTYRAKCLGGADSAPPPPPPACLRLRNTPGWILFILGPGIHKVSMSWLDFGRFTQGQRSKITELRLEMHFQNVHRNGALYFWQVLVFTWEGGGVLVDCIEVELL